jgi:hypothetical protein
MRKPSSLSSWFTLLIAAEVVGEAEKSCFLTFPRSGIFHRPLHPQRVL